MSMNLKWTDESYLWSSFCSLISSSVHYHLLRAFGLFTANSQWLHLIIHTCFSLYFLCSIHCDINNHVKFLLTDSNCQQWVEVDGKPQVNVGSDRNNLTHGAESSREINAQPMLPWVPCPTRLAPQADHQLDQHQLLSKLVYIAEMNRLVVQACKCINHMLWSLAMVMRDTVKTFISSRDGSVWSTETRWGSLLACFHPCLVSVLDHRSVPSWNEVLQKLFRLAYRQNLLWDMVSATHLRTLSRCFLGNTETDPSEQGRPKKALLAEMRISPRREG